MRPASLTGTTSIAQPVGRLLAPDDVAARLAISRSMVYKLVRTHELPALRVGRLPRICEFDLEAYIERQRQKGVQ